MSLQNGAAALAAPIRNLYAPLFESSHNPAAEPPETLKNLFNIHSGGGERTLEFQMTTFKALCESTSFEGSLVSVPAAQQSSALAATGAPNSGGGVVLGQLGAAVNINLHIHLPENKTRRDYEAMIEDIGRYIFGRSNGGGSGE